MRNIAKGALHLPYQEELVGFSFFVSSSSHKVGGIWESGRPDDESRV